MSSIWIFPVLYGHNDACNAKSKTQTISASGYISSHVTTETGCGSVDKPWQLKVGSGQRINITLFDFSFATSGRNSAGDQTHVCTVYAIVKETVSGGQTRTVCGGKYREANVYLSLTNSLEIRVIGKRQKDDDDNVSFMLRYEGEWCSYSLRVVHGSDGPVGRVGSGRVTILPDFGGSGLVGSALRFFNVFYWLFFWYMNRFESSNTAFGLIDFLRYLIYNN